MRIISCLLIFLAGFCNLNGEIIKTNEMQDIRMEITPDTLVLFNLAEVLMDTETSLGTQAWRKFLRTRVDSQTHDELTLAVFESVPPKCPESLTPEIIKELQSSGYTVFAMTSRGRNEWYSSKVSNVDLITERLLRKIDINFSHTQLIPELAQLPVMFNDYFHEGIIYAGNTNEKGQLLREIFEKTGYFPSKVVFVDDKADSLKEVETTLQSLNIPFVGYVYSRTAQDHASFDPQIANIQLDWLLRNSTVLSDQEAEQIKLKGEVNPEPDAYIQEIAGLWWFLQRLSEPINFLSDK